MNRFELFGGVFRIWLEVTIVDEPFVDFVAEEYHMIGVVDSKKERCCSRSHSLQWFLDFRDHLRNIIGMFSVVLEGIFCSTLDLLVTVLCNFFEEPWTIGTMTTRSEVSEWSVKGIDV